MAVTQIIYDADQVGIHPATQTSSGYKLDHNAYSVLVRLSDDLMDALNARKGAGTLVYRFDSYDAAGGYDRTETAVLDLQTPQIEFDITKLLTATSGNVRIIPVVTSVNGNTTVFERRLGIITLNIRATPESAEDEYKEALSLSALERSARAAAADALEAKEICLEAKEATEAARTAFESGNLTFIFDGGNSRTNTPINVVVDNAITQYSHNPVTSAAIYAAMVTIQNNLETYITNEVEQRTAGLVAQAEANVYQNCFGKGGVIISADPEYNPNGIVPGTWELIGAGLTLICAGTAEWGTEYEVGATGGEHQHTLSVNEIPSHQHSATHFVMNNNAHPFYIANGNTATLSTATNQEKVDSAGGGHPHNNMPPYLAVNIWVRVENEEE